MYFFEILQKNIQNARGFSSKIALNTSFKVPGVFLNSFFLFCEIDFVCFFFSVVVDSSCFYTVFGCPDPMACNYDPLATDADGSCYNNDLGCGCDTPGPIEGYDCDGNELQYQVGGYAEGGIVFYLDETGEHGLVAAMEDLTEGATIDSEGNPGYQWGCFATWLSGADGQAIGCQQTVRSEVRA